ncbi:MAG: adenosine deaminase [Pseudomonadota bacterium]
MSRPAQERSVSAQFIKRLPKCELHLHVEGCLEPELMFELADRNKIKLKYKSVGDVRKAYNFSNLQSFLDVYYEGASVLKREEDFYDLTISYFKKAAEQNVRHAEIFFDPQTHTDRGVPFEVVIRGIARACEDARQRLDVSNYLILSFLRHLSGEAAMETLNRAIPFKDKIAGVGLDSTEVGHPATKFREVFEAAKRHGLPGVAHAGEEGPPAYIWDALNHLNALRIDHGVRSLEDEALVRELAARKIPLTVCPLSNVRLGVFPDMKKHPLRTMLEKGLMVTINSDDPAYFGGYLNENFIEAQKALALTRDEIVQLARNSFQASFLPEEGKRTFLREIDASVGED